MFEIKGQLLGIVLVLTIFGVVTVAMTTGFERAADTVQERIENEVYHGTSQPSHRADNRAYNLVY